MTPNVAETERAKYEEIWSIPDYLNAESPGVINVDRFMSVVKPVAGYSLLDIGCGAGKAGIALEKHGLDVWWLDICGDALSPEVPKDRFIEAALWDRRWRSRKTMGWDYGFCCDVMEHIPTEYTMLVLDHILSACRTTWFSIALRPDVFGQLIGQPLHLTVRDFNWWETRLASIGDVIEARDICGDGVYVCSR